MFIGIRDCVIYQAGWESLRAGAAALGLDAVEVAVSRELAVPHPELREDLGALSVASTRDARRTRWLYANAGLTPCALFLPTNFNAPRLSEEVTWVAGALRAAAAMGVGAVRVDAAMTNQNGLPLAERAERFARVCRDSLEAASEHAARIAVENHGPQGNDPQWLTAVLGQLDPARVGLALDPANLYWEGHELERVYELVAELAPRALFVHCKNLRLRDLPKDLARSRVWQYARAVTALHDGDLDWGRLVAELTAAGFEGGLVLEEEALALVSPSEREEMLRQDIACLREAVRAVTC